jgi:very-short-patch-repair endonuclease
MGHTVYGPFPAPCPQCGYDDSWGDLGCMECGLEFWPPSEAWQSASTLSVADRVANLREEWGGPMARERIRDPWDWCEPDPDPLVALSAQEQLAPLPASASPIEKIFWDAHRKLRLPELEGMVFQHKAGPYWMDFALPDRLIGIELDGFRNHSNTEDLARDHIRQRWLGGLKWYIVRFGGKEITQDAEARVKEMVFHVETWGAPGPRGA